MRYLSDILSRLDELYYKKNLSKDKKWDFIAFGIILLAGFLIRLACIVIKSTKYTNCFYLPDSLGYETLAINLIKFQRFSRIKVPPYTPDAYRTPIYPFYLALIYLVTGSTHPFFPAVGQAIISTVYIYLVMQFAKRFFSSRKIAVLTGMLLAFEPVDSIFCSYLMSETVFTLFFVLTFIYFTYYLDEFTLKYLIATGVCLGLATLTRPIALFYFIILLSIIVLCKISHPLQHSLILISVFLLILSPWIIRNKILFGKTTLCTVQHTNINDYDISAMGQYLNGISINQARLMIKKTRNHSNSYRSYVKKIIQEPIAYVNLRFLWLFRMFFDLGDGVFFFRGSDNFIGVNAPPRSNLLMMIKGDYKGLKNYLVKFTLSHSKLKSIVMKMFLIGYIVYLLTIYSFFLIGASHIYRQKSSWTLFTFFTLIYFLFFPGSVSSARFRINIMPFLIIIAVFGFFKIINQKYIS